LASRTIKTLERGITDESMRRMRKCFAEWETGEGAARYQTEKGRIVDDFKRLVRIIGARWKRKSGQKSSERTAKRAEGDKKSRGNRGIKNPILDLRSSQRVRAERRGGHLDSGGQASSGPDRIERPSMIELTRRTR